MCHACTIYRVIHILHRPHFRPIRPFYSIYSTYLDVINDTAPVLATRAKLHIHKPRDGLQR